MVQLVVKKIILLVAIVCILLSGILFFISPYLKNENTFLAASIDKQNRLKNLPSPGLVFIGGSGLAFGIDSKRIQDSLGIPTANMGLHAGLGLTYILNEAIDNLKPGHIVILSPEYTIAESSNAKLASQLVDVNPQALKYICSEIQDYIEIFFANIQRCTSGLFYKVLEVTGFSKNTDKLFLRSSFSAEGDYIGHLNEPSRYVFAPDSDRNANYATQLASLNKFIKLAKNKKCCVYYLYASIAESAYTDKSKAISEFKKEVQKHLDCIILDSTSPLPDSLFFGTHYHLTGQGRKIKTDHLIELFKRENIAVNCN
jgi:hypothetical protein